MRRPITLPTLALLAGVVIVALVGGLAHRELIVLDDRARWVSHSHEVLEIAEATATAISDAVSARRAFALTGDEAALAPYRDAVRRITQARDRLRALTVDNPRQQRRLDDLDRAVAERLAQLDDAIRQRRALGFSPTREAQLTSDGDAETRRLRAVVDEFTGEEYRLRAEREVQRAAEAALVERVMVAGFLAAAALLLSAFLMLRREAARRARYEARFRHVIEGAPDGIVVADRDGRVAIVNDRACALFGYAADELIGQPVERLIPELSTERDAGDRRGDDAAPVGSALQLLARRKNGAAFPVEVSLNPFESGDGIHVIAAIRDITRRRELERFRDEYVGYISHDLKNPLSVIMLQARLLARQLAGRAGDDDLRALRVIADSAGQVDHLVRELLEMAYVESDQIEIRPEPVALAPFLQSVLERTLSTSDRSRARLEIVRPASVSAERARLERVIVNLLQNAIKYAPAGSPITLRLEVDGERAVVSVLDEGPGVPADQRALVFEKYKRAASAQAKDGLGLGLYISRKIIEAHGGEIAVDDAPGKGARFFFRLPRIADVSEPAPGPAAPAAPAAPSRLTGTRLLLVDDEASAVSALVALLGDEGLEVTGATSAARALAIAEAARPDVVVVDLQMPGMSGLELLDRLRARYPDLPAVIMTGHTAEHAGVAAARASGVAYVEKPVDVDALLRTLDRVLLVGRA